MPILVKSAGDCVLGDYRLWNLSFSDGEDAVVYIVIMNLAGNYFLADFMTSGSNVFVDDG